MVKIRRTWILWFVFLAFPGSGQLRFDGLPFSSKSEFAVLCLAVCALFSSEFRKRCRSLLASNNLETKQWVNTVLFVAIVLKFFTFVLAPVGDGFESCYRSVYSPPKQEVKCEKSFEAPFLRTSDIHNLDGITRVERSLNFGSSRSGASSTTASETTWRLPFVNEYPRFDAPWLDRMAFTAKFASFVNANNDSFIPIQFVGEISVAVNERVTSLISYEKASVIFVPINKGTQKFRIDYKFADLDVSQIPDRQPLIRGPWAQLFVGKPMRENRIVSSLNLSISGWSLNQKLKQVPLEVELRNQVGKVVAVAKPSARPDVAQAFGDEKYRISGFNFLGIDANLTSVNKSFELYAIYPNQKSIRIGKIAHASNKIENLTKAEIAMTNQLDHLVSIDSASFSLNTQKMQPLAAANLEKSILKIAIFNFLDFLVILGALMIAAITFAALKRKLSELIKIIALCLFSNLLFTYLPFSWWGYKFAVIPIVIGVVVSYSLQINKSLNLIGILPGILAIIVGPSIKLARSFMGLGDAPWWGFQLFRGRASDWFVAQGYARRIFVDGSLNGGENLFYFQPATRYLVFIQHLLFGENDVLLGILMGAGVLMAIVFVAREASLRIDSARSRYLITLFIVTCFLIFVDQIFLGFASAPSSEYPTWILIFITFGLILRGNISQPIAILATIMAALTAQFRPNQAFGALFLFMLVQSELMTEKKSRQLLPRIQLIVVFSLIMSLSLMHNLYYGFGFVVFSVTGGLNSNLSYSDFLNIFNDESIRSMFIDKLLLTFNFAWPPNTLSLTFLVFDLIWLIAVVSIIKLRNVGFKVWIALLLPLTYLVPQLPYDISSYYPRHVVATQLAFVLSGLYVISRQTRIDSEMSSSGDGNLSDTSLNNSNFLPHEKS